MSDFTQQIQITKNRKLDRRRWGRNKGGEQNSKIIKN